MDQNPALIHPNDNHQNRPSGVITLVLTADNHLGYAALGQHPRKREQYKQQLRHAFQQAADFAIGQGVDLFVQAGDLFDTTNPDEQDRSFVAARLAQLRQAGIRAFAVGGLHDTPVEALPSLNAGEASTVSPAPAPQISFARLGALHYFEPSPGASKANAAGEQPLDPAIFDVRGTLVAICGLSMYAGQEGDPLERVHVESDIERVAIPLLILHAPIEGLATAPSLFDIHAQVTRASIVEQPAFRYILAGYHHTYRHLSIGHCDLIIAGATQHIYFSFPADEAVFVCLVVSTVGIRLFNLITLDALELHFLVVHTIYLSPRDTDAVQAIATATLLS